MADNTPNPKSYDQLLGDMLAAYASKQGINDFNVGSAVTSFYEVVALTTARASGDIFQILRDNSVDRATGDTLKRIAAEERVPVGSATPATSTVTVVDSAFQKVSTKIYAGQTAPNIGSVQIAVSSSIGFASTGNLYIGRSTPNVEGPIPYSSITQVGGFAVINLSVPTTKFHNVGETVILAQGGNRSVPVNSIVISPSTGASPDIQYQVTTAGIILDGETTVTGIGITAQLPGITTGNVPAKAIKQFSSNPFPTATVFNPLPITNGQNTDTDDQLRVKIKRARASRGLGSATAVKGSVIGATPSDEQATIVSSEIVNGSEGATLYIDDGNGYEAKTAGVGIEPLVDSAIGGEELFQLATGGRQAPVAKAFLQSSLSTPFDLIGGDTMAIIVGEQTFQHVFADSDFRSPGGATAYEVSASINANTTLGFEATTASGGQFLVIRAIAEDNDSLQITLPTTNGRDASVLVGFPANKVETLRPYKNDVPLSKDGSTASVFTQAQALWSNTIQNGETLILSIDNTSPITFTIDDSDFIAIGAFFSVSSSNSLESWVDVFNAKLTGVTASVVGQQIRLESNLDTNNRAQLAIDPNSTLVNKGMFSSLLGLSAQGKAADFILDRNTAQFELAVPLVAGDKLAMGSSDTEARLLSDQIPGGTINFPADGHVWILVDAQGALIPTGVTGNTLLSVSKPSTNILRFTSPVANAFANVQAGDYVIVWSEQVPSTDRLEGRVNATTGTTVDILVTSAEYAAATTTSGVLYVDGFVVFRSDFVPQKFEIAAGTKTLDQIADELQLQTPSLVFSVLEDEFLVMKSTSKDSNGKLFIVTADTNGKLLSLPVGAQDVSKDSLIAFYDSEFKEADFPLFVHSTAASEATADPIDSYVASFDSAFDLSGMDPNDLISFLHPYGVVRDEQPANEHVQMKSLSGVTVGIVQESNLRRIRTVDRFYVANPLDFGPMDSIVAILDNDTDSKSFELPLYRRAITNTTNPNNPSTFNAYDVDSGTTAQFSASFGTTFDFSNYKALMQAKKVLKAQASQTSILYRSARWGRSGELVNVGYTYPTAANQAISNAIVVDDEVSIRLSVKSGPVVSSSIDSSTEWNVTITPNFPNTGIDSVTYAYAGTGTAPALTLSGGEYVSIGNQTELSPANTGVFRVSDVAGFTPTPTSFSVQRQSGTAVAEQNKSTLVNGQIQFYQSSVTTAADMVSYVNTNLTDFLSATLVNDGGTTGSGVLKYSTFEDTNFTSASVQLKDGINWILSSSLTGSPQFTFKKALTQSSDQGYAFNNGEEIRLVPTTMVQVQQFLSVLAVTGFTTVGTVEVVERSSRLSLATNILGSGGAIQVIGGLANAYAVPVLDSAVRLDNTNSQVSVSKVAAQGIQSDQWFKLEATNLQNKATLFSSNTALSVAGNIPTVGQTTIKLTGRTLTQRYFGKPRHNVRAQGRTFRIEKQGSLVCLSWNGVGSSPAFLKASVNFNDASGGTLNVTKVTGTSEVEYQILSGNTNFSELSIGDLVTVQNMFAAANNGTFLVTGVSDDGQTLRVQNGNSVNQFSFGTYTFSGNSTAGDTFTVDGNALVAGTDFAIGATAADTELNLAAVIGTLPNTTAQVIGNVVKVIANFPDASVTLAYSGSNVVTVSGASLAGYTFAAGDFSASTGVSEGDTMILAAPFAVLNQGKFRVIRRFNDSVWYENVNVIEEEVAMPANLISTGVDATTSIMVNASEHTLRLSWNGVGTQPDFGSVQVGDIVTLGNSFTVGNRGSFMVTSAGSAQQQIQNLTAPAGSQFVATGVGKYFLINSAGDLNQYYAWFNINSGNTDPMVGSLTGIQVNILSGDTAVQVAAKLAAALTGATGLTAVSANNIVTVTTTGSIETTAATNVNVPAPFVVNVTQQGLRSYLEAINPSAANESLVLPATGDLLVDRPQIQFLEYDATVAGDSFVATGDVLTTPNAGSYVVAKVINRDTIVVTGQLASVANASLNGRETSIFVTEDFPYVGYKHVLLASAQPGVPARNLVTFDTNANYDKINEAAAVQIESVSKLSFPTSIKFGLDSYRYNTGLIAEANRIIYGDPRDPVTYPGVGAAGADIFVREPLARRVQVGIDVRLLTGIPFAQVVEQIRTAVSSLINSNDVGQSIAISAIVSAVNSVRGVRAVAIDSPQYDSTHDIIFIAPSEKALIIDPSVDISVSQIGS